MEVDEEEFEVPSSSSKGEKKRFEVKKVSKLGEESAFLAVMAGPLLILQLSRFIFLDNQPSGTPWLYGHGVSNN